MAPQNFTTTGEDPADTWAKMIAQAQGLDPSDTDAADLKALAEITPEPKPVRKVVPQITISQRRQIQSPEAQSNQADMLELVKQYGLASQDALAQQQQGVNSLAEQINGISNKAPGLEDVNFKPLASFFGLNPQAMPDVETPQAKQQRLLGLQMELQKARQGLSKEKTDALKEQIATLKATKDTSLNDQLIRAKIGAYTAAAGGKILPEIAVGKISDFDNSLNELSNISDSIAKNRKLFGPVAGRLNASNPYNKEAQTVQANLNRAKQVIGKAVEGGVLRKEDEEKYIKMLPTLADTADVAVNKWNGFVKKMQESRQSYVSNLQGAGYRTKGIADKKVSGSAVDDGGYEVGKVYNGHRYKGGGYQDQSHWEAVNE